MKGKMTLTKYEKSAADKNADAAGKHSKEGIMKDKRMDAAAVKKMNMKKGK